jgi:folate-binding protein YgfZ
MTAPTVPPPFVLGPETVPPAAADAVLRRAVVATPDVALLEVAGPGAVACMQGLLTGDLETPGAGAFVYGAVLTPKGMIVCDLWAERDRASVRLAVPLQGLAALRDLLHRSLPPRLARVVEPGPDLVALQLAGPRAADTALAAGLSLPPEGRWASTIVMDAAVTVARPPAGLPFGVQVVAPREPAPRLLDRLSAAGAMPDQGSGLELARVLAGWPRLGAEIDDKTLPQEVRYDEIGGVSYTKGCYTGQETVARIHFRGHPNRHLRGLVWSGEPNAGLTEVEQDGRPRGRVTSIAWLPSGGVVGLGVLRREVDEGRGVLAAGAEARVVPLPLEVRGLPSG